LIIDYSVNPEGLHVELHCGLGNKVFAKISHIQALICELLGHLACITSSSSAYTRVSQFG